MNTFVVMIDLISKDAKYYKKCFVAQSRRVHDAWPEHIGNIKHCGTNFLILNIF